MKRLFILFIMLGLLLGCVTSDQQRTHSDALALAENHEGIGQLKFVASLNCDYNYFFDYEPMRHGGFIAYGYKNNIPMLLVIPKYDSHEAKLVHWPLIYSLTDIANLINTYYNENLLTQETRYENVRVELTFSLLNLESNIQYDHGFFVIFTVFDQKHIAIQQFDQLLIYHEETGFLTSTG